LRKHHSALFRDDKLRRHFNEGLFNGFDFDPTMLRIGSMNMALHGVERAPRYDTRSGLPGLGRCSRRRRPRFGQANALTPSKANDGKILVSVDLSEINHKPMPARSPPGHRADFERERADAFMAELLRMTADTMVAKETAPGSKAS
jgi:hypothetical protein